MEINSQHLILTALNVVDARLNLGLSNFWSSSKIKPEFRELVHLLYQAIETMQGVLEGQEIDEGELDLAPWIENMDDPPTIGAIVAPVRKSRKVPGK